MCDEKTLRDEEDYLRRSGSLTRREFGAVSVGAGAFHAPAAGRDRAGGDGPSNVEVATPDGTADCHFAHPASGHPSGRAGVARRTRPAARLPSRWGGGLPSRDTRC